MKIVLVGAKHVEFSYYGHPASRVTVTTWADPNLPPEVIEAIKENGRRILEHHPVKQLAAVCAV